MQDKDNSLRKYKKAENALQLVEDQILPLKMSKDLLRADKAQLEAQQKKAQADLVRSLPAFRPRLRWLQFVLYLPDDA